MQKILILLSICLLSFGFTGCDGHSSKTSPAVDHGPYNVGQSVYNSVETYVARTTQGTQKVAVLKSPCSICNAEAGRHDHNAARQDKHKDRIIAAVNNLFKNVDTTAPLASKPPQTAANGDVFRTLYDLIDDGTLPQLTDAVGLFLQEIAADQETVGAATDFVNARIGCDMQSVVELVRRMLSYPKTPEVCKAIARLIQSNPELLRNLFRIISEGLATLPESGPEAEFMSLLLEILSLEPPVAMDPTLGTPAWMVRLDTNNNYKVTGIGSEMCRPFNDKDSDGVCDTNAAGKPVDAQGNVLDIPAFSNKEYQDSQGQTVIFRDTLGRAVTGSGSLVFEYYNAKKTILGILIYNFGEAIQRNIPRDLFQFARVALLPKKSYTDILGRYEGYSDESDCFKAGLGAINLLKRDLTRHLLRGLAGLLDQNSNGAEAFLVGLGKLLCILRDEPIENPGMIAARIMQLIQSGAIPEILIGLQAMEQIQVPESGMPNMAMLFMYWLSGNIEDISFQVIWPLRSSMLEVKAAYPGDPQLVERLYFNLIKLACGSLTLERDRKMAQVLPVLLRLLVISLAEETDQKVELMKGTFKTLITGRCLASILRCYETIKNTTEATILCDAMVYAMTPQSNPSEEVYSELAKVGVGILQYRQEIKTRVRLFKLFGKFLSPDRPIVTKLVEALNRLLLADNHYACLQALRMACTKCQQYGLAPVFILGHAGIAVMRVGCDEHAQQVAPQDTRRIMDSVSEFLLDPDELLQRLYRVIRNRSSK